MNRIKRINSIVRLRLVSCSLRDGSGNTQRFIGDVLDGDVSLHFLLVFFRKAGKLHKL